MRLLRLNDLMTSYTNARPGKARLTLAALAPAVTAVWEAGSRSAGERNSAV